MLIFTGLIRFAIAFYFMKTRNAKKPELDSEFDEMSELVLAEVNRLIRDHQEDLIYNFEYQDKNVSSKFVNAWTHQNSYPANSYRIHLVVPPEIIIVGECFLTNGNGHRVKGFALTVRNNLENAVIIRSGI
jgi:hypothetical protein